MDRRGMILERLHAKSLQPLLQCQMTKKQGVAVGSEYGLLVTWQSIQSSLPVKARTTAGLSLDDERSEKGNLTSTTELSEGVTMLPPPPDDSNLLKELLRSAGPFQL